MTEINEFRAGFVAVIGRPNVGKSTLVNALLGQKIAAVSPSPQTTRKRQLAILSSEDAQLIFTDTPGIHQAKHKLGGFMNEEALEALSSSDVILFLVDLSVSPHQEDKMIAESISKLLGKIPIVLVLNKRDLIDEQSFEKRLDQYHALVAGAEVIAISAANEIAFDELLKMIIDHLPENPPYYDVDQITDFYERDIAADLIREACLLLLKDEVPHGVAVRIDEYTERGDEGAYIEATIFVERDSQKGIVIGKGGDMIKKISTHARKEIEKMSGRKVFIRMRVKVRKNWRNDDNTLRLFGFLGKGK